VTGLPAFDPSLTGLFVALGIGLLIGAERERRKGEGPTRSAAGIRTFALVALLGAVVARSDNQALVAVTVAGVCLLVSVSYAFSHRDDPGLTTEFALVLSVVLGAMTRQEPAVAAALGVIVAILLAARAPLHHFVRSVLSEYELRSALIFAAASLVVLPVMPDRFYGPFGALNPHTLWLIVILMIGISAAGYIAVRTLGAGAGLAVSGFASGFVSSAATIAAMGSRGRLTPTLLVPAVAGAVLSTVATIAQLGILLAATSPPTLAAVSVPLVCAGFAAVAYAAFFSVGAFKPDADKEIDPGEAFDLATAIKLALTLAVILIFCAALKAWYGSNGLLIASAVGGLADTHAPALAVGQLVSGDKLPASDSVTPILIAMTTNTITKAIIAQSSGDRAFAIRVIPGLGVVIAAAWLGAYVSLRL
jgi:uncharacterized membrane protein (DUF4010 family)